MPVHTKNMPKINSQSLSGLTVVGAKELEDCFLKLLLKNLW